MLTGTPRSARVNVEVVCAVSARLCGALIAFVILFAAQSAMAATARSQEITLAKGWNAICLDVQPADPAVPAVFDPAKVDFVARYFTPASEVRFLDNPAELSWNDPAWGVWYAPDRGEDFLSNLHAIDAGAAYLVHAREAHTLTVTGDVRFRRLRWKTDSFNLTGLPVEGNATITFAQFFSGAADKLGARVYRLANGAWQPVTNLTTTTLRPGEAYWIYCEGHADYQGPLDVRFSGMDGIDLGFHSNASTVELTNRSNAPFSVQATVESNSGLPLYRSVRQAGAVATQAHSLDTAGALGSIAAGATTRLQIETRREQMNAGSGSAVLKLATSNGLVLRIPVHASVP